MSSQEDERVVVVIVGGVSSLGVLVDFDEHDGIVACDASYASGELVNGRVGERSVGHHGVHVDGQQVARVESRRPTGRAQQGGDNIIVVTSGGGGGARARVNEHFDVVLEQLVVELDGEDALFSSRAGRAGEQTLTRYATAKLAKVAELQ